MNATRGTTGSRLLDYERPPRNGDASVATARRAAPCLAASLERAMKQSVIVLFACVVVAGATAASAQSLAEVARKEAERRKEVKTSSKVYTNADVRQSGLLTTASSRMTTPATEPPATTATAEAAGSQSVPAPEEKAPEKDQAYWSGRMSEARDRQRRLELFAESLQTRINSLTTDFVNRDDPAQREVIGQQRRDALAELDRVSAELADARKAVGDIQEEARRSGVPPGWLR